MTSTIPATFYLTEGDITYEDRRGRFFAEPKDIEPVPKARELTEESRVVVNGYEVIEYISEGLNTLLALPPAHIVTGIRFPEGMEGYDDFWVVSNMLVALIGLDNTYKISINAIVTRFLIVQRVGKTAPVEIIHSLLKPKATMDDSRTFMTATSWIFIHSNGRDVTQSFKQ